MRIASGDDPLRQLSIAQPCFACHYSYKRSDSKLWKGMAAPCSLRDALALLLLQQLLLLVLWLLLCAGTMAEPDQS